MRYFPASLIRTRQVTAGVLGTFHEYGPALDVEAMTVVQPTPGFVEYSIVTFAIVPVDVQVILWFDPTTQLSPPLGDVTARIEVGRRSRSSQVENIGILVAVVVRNRDQGGLRSRRRRMEADGEGPASGRRDRRNGLDGNRELVRVRPQSSRGRPVSVKASRPRCFQS